MSTADGTSTAGGTGTADELKVTGALLEDWHTVAAWAADEGWNPGPGDVACFHPTDPAGFFVGRLGDRTVSSVSIVNYSPEYAFLGYYMVHPDLRRGGLGLATWRAALPHAGGRTIGLDGVPAQQATYERAGFTAAYRNLRYAGMPERRPAGDGAQQGAAGDGIQRVTTSPGPAGLDAVAAYDAGCFPATRAAFVSRWLTAEGHTGYARVRDGRVTGYGVIRPAQVGHRVGPLFADEPADAEALFDALVAGLAPDTQVALDIPEPNEAALALAAARGLSPVSHTVRMYAGAPPAGGVDHTYGVTSLELG